MRIPRRQSANIFIQNNLKLNFAVAPTQHQHIDLYRGRKSRIRLVKKNIAGHSIRAV